MFIYTYFVFIIFTLLNDTSEVVHHTKRNILKWWENGQADKIKFKTKLSILKQNTAVLLK